MEVIEKWFPLQGELALFLYFFCMHINRKEEEEGETELLHRLQVHYLTLTFININEKERCRDG